MSPIDLPDDEPKIDREIRIERLRRELEDLAGGSFISGSNGDVPDDLEEAFLTCACEFEKAPQDTNFNRLIQRGLDMPPPSGLDDTSSSSYLQRVIKCARDPVVLSVRYRSPERSGTLRLVVERGAARRDA